MESDQPVKEGKTQKYVHRDLEKEIDRYLAAKEIIAVVGPRQSGKTTLLRNIYSRLSDKRKAFLSFDDREALDLFSSDIKSFAALYVEGNKQVFIDEFQYAREGGKTLKYLYDNYDAKIFISGSSATELSIHSIKYLVGRIFVYTLYPFSFDEFLRHRDERLFALYKGAPHSGEITKRINRFFEEYVIYGGYPRVVLSEDAAEKETILKNIYNTYLLKEVREILGYREDYKLTKLVSALALQTGNTISYEELSNVTGYGYKELLSALNILEKTYIAFPVRPYYTNKRTELSKAPKVYFIDNGLRNCALKDYRERQLRSDAGAMSENFVASELLKENAQLGFWRTKSGAEVDFVATIKGKTIPIEVKSKESGASIGRSGHSFIEKYKPKDFILASLSAERTAKEKDTTIRFLPIWAVKNYAASLSVGEK